MDSPTEAPSFPPAEEAPPRDPDRFPFASWGPMVAVGITLLGLFAGIVGGLPFFLIEGIDPDEDPSTAVSIAAQLMTNLGFVAIPIIAATLLAGGLREGLRQLGFRRFDFGRSLAWAAAGIGAYLAFAILWSTLIGRPEQEDIVDGFGPLGVQILLVVIAAPLAEEIAFRGMLFGGLRTRMPMLVAALATGLFFGLLHFSTGWSAVPVLVFLGVVFCVLYEKTGSIWPPIIVHAVNNGFALTVLTAS